MATASSAQREPSMEEILASIRRIIEDSDTGRKPDDVVGVTQDVEPAAKRTTVDVEAFRAELRTEPQVSKAEELAAVKPAVRPVEQVGAASLTEGRRPHVTLAEVGAQLATEKPAYLPSNGASSLGEVVDTTESREAGIADAVQAPLADEQPWGAAANSSSSVQVDVAVPVTHNEPLENLTSRLAEVEHLEPVADASSSRLAIVSEQTSRQVAAAFGELSEAFATRSKKTFDDMAEEMLKPMLQDWLDNNLPTLVERLVREEIERVARGA